MIRTHARRRTMAKLLASASIALVSATLFAQDADPDAAEEAAEALQRVTGVQINRDLG